MVVVAIEPFTETVLVTTRLGATVFVGATGGGAVVAALMAFQVRC